MMNETNSTFRPINAVISEMISSEMTAFIAEAKEKVLLADLLAPSLWEISSHIELGSLTWIRAEHNAFAYAQVLSN